jgi:hypothetical protein
MADGLYAKFKERVLSGEIDMLSDDIKCVLVDANDYTVDLAEDEFLSDIPVGARVATSANLTGKSTTGGIFDADDATFTAPTGDQCEALVVYKDSGDPATSPLGAYIDEAVGLPVTPAGVDITVAWDNGARKIFAL